MADSPRDELADLARLLGVHLAWQRELGVELLPGEGTLPAPPAAQGVEVPRTERSEAPAAAPSRGVNAPPVAVAKEPPLRVERSPVAPVALPEAQSLSLFGDAAPATKPVGAARERAPRLEGEARIDALRVLQDEVKGCTLCGLAKGRKNTVFARGNPFARLVFIGEGPGEQEDLSGLPFVGPAGQLLDRIITRGMGLDPARDVYVCNVVKCRPPNNRVPDPPEMAACAPFLVRQLELVHPEVIVALGRTAVSFLLDTKDSMTKLRGRWRSYQDVPVLPTWHPAYLLRNPGAKGETWSDMKLVLERLGLPVPGRS